eukprot:2074517-Rhodomonas_salina.1
MRVLTQPEPASHPVAGLAALVREWFDAGFYPTGVRAGSNAHPASAAMVRAVIVSAGESMARSAGADGRVEDIASLPTPNLHAGFGRCVCQVGCCCEVCSECQSLCFAWPHWRLCCYGRRMRCPVLT